MTKLQLASRRPVPKDDATPVVLSQSGTHPRVQDRCTLTVLAGPGAGVVVTLEGGDLVLGRGLEADLTIEDIGISRRHVRIFRDLGGVYIEDLGSRNGTSVDGFVITERVCLRDGARVRIGQSTVVRIDVHDAVEQAATRRLYESSVRDPLTGLFNRRHLDERLVAEVAHATRHGADLALLLVDLDHFKRINDDPGLGHLAGDAVLRAVGLALQRLVRTEDLVARYGGEELVVVARTTPVASAAVLAERVRQAIEAVDVRWERRHVRVTASVGVASLAQASPRTVDALLMRADEALYMAKNAGRNRVIVAG